MAQGSEDLARAGGAIDKAVKKYGSGSSACPRSSCMVFRTPRRYASVEFGARLAAKTRARFVSFPGGSHWWQLERPAEVAVELERFWSAPNLG